jgi:hypothetical protein
MMISETKASAQTVCLVTCLWGNVELYSSIYVVFNFGSALVPARRSAHPDINNLVFKVYRVGCTVLLKHAPALPGCRP